MHRFWGWFIGVYFRWWAAKWDSRDRGRWFFESMVGLGFKMGSEYFFTDIEKLLWRLIFMTWLCAEAVFDDNWDWNRKQEKVTVVSLPVMLFKGKNKSSHFPNTSEFILFWELIIIYIRNSNNNKFTPITRSHNSLIAFKIS